MSPNAELSLLCHIPPQYHLQDNIAGRLGLKYSINTISVSQYLEAKFCKIERFIRNTEELTPLFKVATQLSLSSVPSYFKMICFSSCLLDEGKGVYYVHIYSGLRLLNAHSQSIAPAASPTLGNHVCSLRAFASVSQISPFGQTLDFT